MCLCSWFLEERAAVSALARGTRVVRTAGPVEILAPRKTRGLSLYRVMVVCLSGRRTGRDGDLSDDDTQRSATYCSRARRPFPGSRRPALASASSGPSRGSDDTLRAVARIDGIFGNGPCAVQAVHKQRHPRNGLPRGDIRSRLNEFSGNARNATLLEQASASSGWLCTGTPRGRIQHSASTSERLATQRKTPAIGMISGVFTWWALPGSNRRHPRCKRGALPAELKARVRMGTPEATH